MRLTILFLFVFTPFFCFSKSESLASSTLLRKISLHIRGLPPAPQEYEELQNVPPHKRDSFLKNKVKQYLKSTQHHERMKFRLAELFKLKTPSTLKNMYNSQDPATKEDSLSQLFLSLAQNNLSWDTLLTGKKYNLINSAMNDQNSDPFQTSDIGFFKLAYEKLPETYQGVISGPVLMKAADVFSPSIQIDFAKNDPRIAGALTTKRFLSRYTTTAINKNRRRAAAVFRIFLCDPMIPAIESGTDRKHEFLDSTFAENFEVTDEMISAQMNSDKRHGTDENCLSCHSKLDPLGRTFQGSGVVLHPEPFSGRLFYKRSNTETVDIPAQGIGDLAESITQQKEYVNCQVQWFWDQFIGINVPLSENRHRELVHAFNSVQRRTNDFIEVLINSPEFRSRPKKSQEITFSQVKGLLKRCDSCHSNQYVIPVFSSLPIGFTGKTEEQKKWLLKIKERLSLPKGHKDQMPKDRDKAWLEAEIKLLMEWLNTGAKDDKNNSLLGVSK